MQSENKARLLEVIQDVLEQFAFIFVEEELQSWNLSNDSTLLWSGIRFYGSEFSGTLELASSARLCREIARNTLGEEDDNSLPKDAEFMALQELANILCGNLVARIYGPEASFKLHPPQSSEMSFDKWHNMAQSKDTLIIAAEDQPLLVRFSEAKTNYDPSSSKGHPAFKSAP